MKHQMSTGSHNGISVFTKLSSLSVVNNCPDLDHIESKKKKIAISASYILCARVCVFSEEMLCEIFKGKLTDAV